MFPELRNASFLRLERNAQAVARTKRTIKQTISDIEILNTQGKGLFTVDFESPDPALLSSFVRELEASQYRVQKFNNRLTIFW